MRQGYFLGSLYIGQYAVQVGGANEIAVFGQHAYQGNAITIGIHHFYLLRKSVRCSHHGDCGHQ